MIVFHDGEVRDEYSIAILIKQGCLNKRELHHHYIAPLDGSIPKEHFIALGLQYNTKTISIRDARENLKGVISACKFKGVRVLLVADTAHFKALTKVGKIDNIKGEIVTSIYENKQFDVILTLNYKALYYNPDRASEINVSLTALVQCCINLGILQRSARIQPEIQKQQGVLKLTEPADYPRMLKGLNTYDRLTCDVETTSLHSGQVVSIAFSIDDKDAVTAAVAFDISCNDSNPAIIHLFRKFFEEYKGTLIYHNAPYDIKNIIRYLFLSVDNSY
jgi:DNA polymerase-1